MSALVSVVVPFLNPSAAFLREAVGSVVAQSYAHWEILLVNDGSANGDGLRAAHAMAAEFCGGVRLVTYDDPGTRGASAARNEGLRHARGAYVAFLDADDVWLPEKLALEVAALRAEPAVGMAYSSYLYWHGWTGDAADARRDWTPPLGVEPGRSIPAPRFVAQFLTGRAAVPTPSCTLFRREVLEEVGGFETAFPGLYDDQVLFAKVGLRHPVLPLQELTTLYRQHDASICARARRETEETARRRYLAWLDGAVSRVGQTDPDLIAAIREQAWNLDHPRLARAQRWWHKTTRRLPLTAP